ncbi:MAG TPA: hypothetical protein PLW35_04965 [Verrucomicrobiota bacterium]|nr:hypothetical protein [Verrucomicrobiota bacterium]HOK77056.1 hypothetical protein [Verrucomicrobiota bacterium]
MRAWLAEDYVKNLAPAPQGVVRLNGLAGLAEFVEKAAPEIAATAMIYAVNQAAYLLGRQLESQWRTLEQNGGCTERLYEIMKRMR